VGIFSTIFKKKNESSPDALGSPTTRQRAGEPSRLVQDDDNKARQREIARATAAKIDAIESAMADDIFNTPEPAFRRAPRRKSGPALIAGEVADTLPMLELATTELLADEDRPGATAYPQTAPVIEEIAIMFANNQMAVSEQMLIETLRDLGTTDRTVWWMLFDLFQISNRQDDFDNIAIDYASQFETSPPSWAPPAVATGTENTGFAGVTPTAIFAGVLDAAALPQIERLQQLAEANPVLRLEFARVSDVDPEGCALLLGALKKVRQRELIVAGAADLAELLRSTIIIGQREASEAPWLLLLELLQLMNQEKDFEEIAMDYCVTYEVSPPSFEAPQKVATAASARTSASAERFLLPGVIEGASTGLFDAIDQYAGQADALLFDCSRLARIDYSAAAALLIRLRPIADEKKIEFRDMNHLVAALFKLMGYADVAKLFPHKY
jgi:ABC-type transporter Mla MlaB component